MNRKFKYLILMGVVGLILALISATYAYWMITKTQTNSNVITSKCLDISITGETNDINVSDAYPITDEEGEATVPYTFTITNNCDSAVEYQVLLEAIGTTENKLNASSIKAQLDDKKSRTLDKYLNVIPTIQDSYSAYKLTTGVLEANGEEGDSKTYNLRLWIDEAVTIEESGKTFEAKVSVSVGESVVPFPCERIIDDGFDAILCGSETFYVIEENENSITALAKYTLGINELPTKQSSVFEPIAFSETNYWWDNANNTRNTNYLDGGQAYINVFDANSYLYEYVNNYENYLRDVLKISSASLSLMTLSQAASLGCIIRNYNCKSVPSFVTLRNYWLDSSYNGYKAANRPENMWGVMSYKYLVDTSYSNDTSLGIRPVMNISMFDIK